MNSIRALGSRASVPGWLALILAVLSLAANIEGTISLGQRMLNTPVFHLPAWVPWSLGLIGIIYLARLWYAERIKEPLRQLLRSSAIKAAEHLDSLSNKVERVLDSRCPIGRLASLALADRRSTMQRLRGEVVQALENQRGFSGLGIGKIELRLVAFLNAYEHTVYRLRDGGQAVDFDFQSDGNYREWKRFDADLLSSVRHLISQSRYSVIRETLENSIWKDGVRHYL